MFNIYQSIFGLKFEKIAAPYKWIDDLQLYVVTDSATGEPLGMFYLDMFPREGKFNHFAAVRNHRRQTVAGWKISAADRRVALQFSAADSGQAVAC